MDSSRATVIGLSLLAVASITWLLVLAMDGASGTVLTAVLLVLVGALTAAWAGRTEASRPWPFALGLAVAAAGAVWFLSLATGIGSFDGMVPLANHLFAIGLATSAVLAVLAAAGVGPTAGSAAIRWPMAVAALGALLWVPGDGLDGIQWQPGNLLALSGLTLIAWKRA